MHAMQIGSVAKLRPNGSVVTVRMTFRPCGKACAVRGAPVLSSDRYGSLDVCVSCTLQGLEQGAAAGSASGAVGLLAAGLASVGFRGAANRLVAVSPRLVAFATGAVAIGVLLTVMPLQPL
jgi:hypothetical protein